VPRPQSSTAPCAFGAAIATDRKPSTDPPLANSDSTTSGRLVHSSGGGCQATHQKRGKSDGHRRAVHGGSSGGGVEETRGRNPHARVETVHRKARAWGGGGAVVGGDGGRPRPGGAAGEGRAGESSVPSLTAQPNATRMCDSLSGAPAASRTAAEKGADGEKVGTFGLRQSIMRESVGQLSELIVRSTSILWVNRTNFTLPVQDGNNICLSGGWDMNGDALYLLVVHHRMVILLVVGRYKLDTRSCAQ